MSYIVLARKYRPQTFDEVVGQGHITDLLKKSIQAKRLAHAYLFCGPRGIGKTSCARILAKSLNCKEGPTLTPCGICPACKEISNSNSFDVIEIDGASNRGIDEIRTLRENVKFAPSYGRYKIYIVDEVHMLTTEAFNALLKTLEEPPEHVKFILATTSPSKVPATIISRCQRFDFRRASMDVITATLSAICAKEKIKIDKEALFVIAKAASGSLRDSLSILDQLSALIAQDIKMADVYAMLGTIETELLFELIDGLAQKNCAAALTTFDKIVTAGKDIKQLNKDLIEHFRNLMIVKVGGQSLGKLIEYPVVIKDRLLAQSQHFSLQEILRAVDIFVEAQEFARKMDSLHIPLEIAFAKLTYQPQKDFVAPKPSIARVSPFNVLADKKGYVEIGTDDTKNIPNTPNIPNPPAPVSVSDEEDLSLGTPDVAELPVEAEALSLNSVRAVWDGVTHAISRQKMSVATFLQEGSPHAFNGTKLTIIFPKEASFHKESLEEKDNLRMVEKAFSEKLNASIVINFKIGDEFKPVDNEPFIKNALDTFKGKVVNKWHRDG